MKILLLLVVSLAFLALLARYIERHNIYFPMREINSTPESIGLAYQDVFLTTSDGRKLNAWFVPAGEPSGLTVLFCHGNGGNISHRLEKISLLRNLGLDVFIFDYRGYGKSDGVPSNHLGSSAGSSMGISSMPVQVRIRVTLRSVSLFRSRMRMRETPIISATNCCLRITQQCAIINCAVV